MGFPANELKCSGGEMYSHIFENSRTKLKRNIFWSLTINFLPIRHCDDDYDCSFTIDWMRFPFKNWTELNGSRFKGKYGYKGCEASFYTVEHDCARNFDIRFSYQKDNIFKVSFVAEIDFSGITEDDSNPRMKISGETDIIYEGLTIIPANLETESKSLSDLTKIAGNYIDLESYDVPYEDRKNGSFLFRPKIK